jgi:hypothetical protein
MPTKERLAAERLRKSNAAKLYGVKCFVNAGSRPAWSGTIKSDQASIEISQKVKGELEKTIEIYLDTWEHPETKVRYTTAQAGLYEDGRLQRMVLLSEEQADEPRK